MLASGRTAAAVEPDSRTAVPLTRTAAAARDTIWELIREGAFTPGAKLPGERELAETARVSRTVLRTALAALAEEGIVESSPWRGWFVRGPAMAERVTMRSFTEMARAQGLTPGASVIGQAVRAATDVEADALGLVPVAPVLELHRLRLLNGVPACVDTAIIPLERARSIEEAVFEDASLYELLERLCGTRIVRSDYEIHAEPAHREDARHLRVAEGEPVLVGEEVAFDENGRRIILGRAVYRREAYRFRATLFRT